MSVVCTPYGEGGGGWPETRPSVLFRWLCWEERTPSLGLDGSEGRRRFFSPVLTLNTLPFIAWYLSVSLSACPQAGSLAPSKCRWLLTSGCWVHPPSHFLPCPLVSVCLHFRVPALGPPLVSGLPVHPSPFVSPGPMEEEPGYFPQD